MLRERRANFFFVVVGDRTIALHDMELLLLDLLEYLLLLYLANLRVLVAIHDVVLRYRVVALVHDRHFDDVLYLLDGRDLFVKARLHFGDDCARHIRKFVFGDRYFSGSECFAHRVRYLLNMKICNLTVSLFNLLVHSAKCYSLDNSIPEIAFEHCANLGD